MSRKGLTLIETVVAMGLSLLVLTVLSDLFIQTRHLYLLENNTSQLTTSSQTAIARIDTIVRQGVSIESSYNSYTAGNNRIIIKLPTVNSAGQLLLNTYDYVIYQLDPTNTTRLQEIVAADSASRRRSRTRTAMTNLASFTVRYQDANGTTVSGNNLPTTKRVTVTIDRSEKSYRDVATVSQTATIMLRNK